MIRHHRRRIRSLTSRFVLTLTWVLLLEIGAFTTFHSLEQEALPTIQLDQRPILSPE